MHTQVTGIPRWGWAVMTAVVMVAAVVIVAALAGTVIGRSQQAVAAARGAPETAAAAADDGDIVWRKLALPLADLWFPSGSDGPARSAPGRWSGWSRTEAGAVQAGYMWLACAALDHLAAADCVRSHYTGALVEPLAQLHLTRPPALPREEVGPVGYDVSSWSPETARVAYRTSAGSTMLVNLTWRNEDWKIVADSDESRPRNAAQVAPDEVFELTPWGPSDG